MLSRLIFSTFRQNANFQFQHGQTRNFRRLASTSTTSTTDTAQTPLINQLTNTPSVTIGPKRAPAPYALFVQEKFKTFGAPKGGRTNMGETARNLALQWKNLNADEKQRYENESARMKKEYEDAFMRMSTEELRRAVLDEMARIQKKRVTALRRQQKELKEKYEFPKAGIDYFRIQAMAQYRASEMSKVKNAADRGRKMGDLWNNLSAEEKNVYEKREKTARTRYNNAIDAWKESMIKKGLRNVVDTIGIKYSKKLSGPKTRQYRLLARGKTRILASKVSAGKARTTRKTATKRVTKRRGTKKAKVE